MGIRCGNPVHPAPTTHESVAEVRHCFASVTVTPEAAEAKAEAFLLDLHHDVFTQSGAAYQEILNANPDLPEAIEHRARVESWRAGREGHGPINRTAVLASPVDSLLDSGVARLAKQTTPFRVAAPATEPQIRFAKILLEERDWVAGLEIGTDQAEWAMDLSAGKNLTKPEATSLIGALKLCPKKAAPVETPKVHSEQPWRKLSHEVPAGNYCVQVDGKNHFYRVSVGRNDFYKLQERASEELHFVPLRRYAGILQTILDRGIKEAGMAYATEMGRCYRCGLTLTDNTGNPYFSQGLGPDCGAK